MKKLFAVALFAASFYTSMAQTNAFHLSKKLQQQFVGVWSLVAVENINPDSSKTLPYGENPQGMLVFEPNGDYAIQILKAARPTVAAKDKNKATPEENAALVKGNNSHFGTYSINDVKHVITFNVQHAFYPNWEGDVQQRSYTLENNVLRYVVTNTTNGGAITAVVVWKKK
ncbi:lipocalin-like domain-containing protein [Parafilimonas sp.]|uniref:lipocalin-like domain-containing protein n=1 Tax=Parafilimonas sp. TaxID=1969739 RepID=UPI0039E30550